ncbi:MAG: type II secretion system protein [bacterium]|nr:type II secretion system protein [bacterium]
MNISSKLPKKATGFTIIELTIATAVFSTVLLVGLASFLGIGKIFYKGVTLTQTQDAGQAVLDQLSSDLQFAPTVGSSPPAATGPQFFCIGNVRYTYNLYQIVNSDDHDNQTKFGLLRDVLPGSSGCANPFGANAVALASPTELLGNKLRLSKLDVAPAKNSAGSDIKDLWNINLTLAYGDDNSLKNGGTANPVCDANLTSTQFCSVVNLSTSLNRGL